MGLVLGNPIHGPSASLTQTSPVVRHMSGTMCQPHLVTSPTLPAPSQAMVWHDTRTFDADAVDLTADDTFAPSNCSYFYIGVRGDNRYPQKTGASEYNLVVFTSLSSPTSFVPM